MADPVILLTDVTKVYRTGDVPLRALDGVSLRVDEGAVSYTHLHLAEARACLEVRMSAEGLAHVPVEPDVMEEVIALEDAVLLHDEMVLLGDVRLHDRRSDVRVIRRAEGIPDVVQERAGDVLFVLAGLTRACRGLQAMLQPCLLYTSRCV